MPLSEDLYIHSKLGSLPPEMITKIMEELDWFSLMNVRKTCRYLCDISKSLAVWQRQLRLYVRRHKYAARLEAPLDTFTASELEDWVSRRVSADAGWESANRRPTGIRKINRSVYRACLVPGGRWLLIGGRDGTLIAYDLDAPGVQGRPLLEIPNRKIESMCISIDRNSPNFAFNIAISSSFLLSRGDSIHIWTVSISGRGSGAYLQARPLRTFQAPSISIQAFNITMRNDLVARIMHNGNGSCHVEVFNWLNTRSTLHSKQVIHLEEIIHHIRLLPGDRLLIFTEGYIRVYDVQPTVSDEPSLIVDPAFLPRWQLPCPLGHRTANGGISEASIDASYTQFTFVAENPNTIYGLTIPHDVSEFPVLRKIANFPGDHYPAVAVGFEKMFIAFERNWKADRDKLSGSVIRLGIPWMENGPSSEVIAVQGVHSYEYPTEWYAGWPPLLDEGSGRIVQPFGNKGLLVMDTALCFSQ